MISLPTKSSPPFPKTGIKFFVFQEFIERCGGISALINKRTEEVCQEFLIPMTKELKLSYCELLKLEKDQKKVGTASVFISHAWKFNFLDVVEAIGKHFEKEIVEGSEFYIWFDLFSNNQHITGELDFQWWTQTFKSAIEQFHHTVIILAPWNNPIPFKRAWCLWEIYCSIITESKFEVALSDNEHSSLIQTMISDFEAVEQMISNINCERSECWKPEDRLNIFNAVRLTEGFDHINSIIMNKMHSWLLSSVLNEFEHNSKIIKDSLKYFQLLVVIGKIQFLRGNYEDAKESFIKVFDYYNSRDELLRNQEYPEHCYCYLDSCLHLAQINFSYSIYDEAYRFFDIHVQYMANDEESLCDQQVKLKISFMIIKLKLLIQNSNFHDSYESLLKYYKLSIRRLTKKSILTITFMGIIGYLYYNLGENEKSNRYFIEALNIINTNNFSNYLFAIEIKYYYCLLLIRQGDYLLSKQIMEQCYRFCSVNLGLAHPRTMLYYFLFEKSSYFLEPVKDLNRDVLKMLERLLGKLSEFESAFPANSIQLLDIYRFIYYLTQNKTIQFALKIKSGAQSNMLINTFNPKEFLLKYMNILQYHYCNDSETFRDEYIKRLLQLAKVQSKIVPNSDFDLEGKESFENYQLAINIMKPLLPLHRADLIRAYKAYSRFVSDLNEREKILQQTLLLEKEQSQLSNYYQYFSHSDIKFYLANTYYRQGKYYQWFKNHFEHIFNHGGNKEINLSTRNWFCSYFCNIPFHCCCQRYGTIAESTRNVTSPCDTILSCLCFPRFCGGPLLLFPIQYLCCLPCDGCKYVASIIHQQQQYRLIDHEDEFIEQVQMILNTENSQTFFSMKEIINKINEIIKIVEASGKLHTKIKIEEMLLSFLENYENISYNELRKILDQLINDYDKIQDFIQMENIIQQRLYLEINKSGLYSKSLLPFYYLLVYTKLQQRKYVSGIINYCYTLRLGNCCQSFCLNDYWMPSSFIWDIPFHCCSSILCCCCCSNPIGRPFHSLRHFPHDKNQRYTFSCMLHCILQVATISMLVPCLYCYTCYGGRYRPDNNLDDYRYYEEMSLRNYVQIKNLQNESTTNKEAKEEANNNKNNNNDDDYNDDQIMFSTMIRNPSFQFKSMTNLDQPKSMRMERFEEDLLPRTSSNFGKQLQPEQQKKKKKMMMKPEDLIQILVEDEHDDENIENDERIAAKTNILIDMKLKQGLVLRGQGKINQAKTLLTNFTKSSFGKNSIDILELLGELNYFYHGEYQLALEYYQQVVTLRQSIQGDLHKRTLSAIFMVGECYRKVGNYTKSLEIHESLYKMYLKVYGANHSLTYQSLDMIIHLYQVTFQFRKAYQSRLLFLQHTSSMEIKKNHSSSKIPNYCFQYGIVPMEMIVENVCCIPIVLCPIIMNDFISSSYYCYDPICCKRTFMEMIMCPISTLFCFTCGLRDPDCIRFPLNTIRDPVK